MNKRFSDKEIIDIIRSGEMHSSFQKVVNQLYFEYREKTIKRLAKENINIVDAEDITQQALGAFLVNLNRGKFKGNSSLYTYYWNTCQNIYHDFLKTTIKKRNGLTEVLNFYSEEDINSPESIYLREEEKEIIQNLLTQVGEKCRKLLYFYKQGYSSYEIANMLGYGNEKVVDVLQYKCRSKLLKILRKNKLLKQYFKEHSG